MKREGKFCVKRICEQTGFEHGKHRLRRSTDEIPKPCDRTPRKRNGENRQANFTERKSKKIKCRLKRDR